MKKISVLLCFLGPLLSAWAQLRLPDQALRADSIAFLEGKFYQNHLQASSRISSVASSNFDVNFYRCQWQVDPAVRYIRGRVTSYFTVTAATNSVIFDLNPEMKVDSIIFRNNRVSFQQTPDEGLTIMFGQALTSQQKDSVSVYYQGVPVSEGYGSFVTATQVGTPVMWTLSEPYGARSWWPCKNTATDKADSIDIILSFPEIYHSSSNGRFLSELKADGIKTAYWKHRYPIASYLVAFAITNYVIETDSARVGEQMMPLYTYAYPADAGDFRNATRVAKQCLERFSALFGPYPFRSESYSQTQFGSGGGMEHQTNSFITSPQDQLAAHELGHQWFGNQVTCASWQDVWLNEGFAQYLQYLFLENFYPALGPAHLESSRQIITSERGGSVKVDDTTNVDRMFNFRLTYSKGAYLVHMIRWRLGDSIFFKSLRAYLNDPRIAYRTARTSDLQRNLEQVSGQDFSTFFRDWYEGEGFPSYQVTWSANNNNRVEVRISQTTSHPSVSFYEMPVPLTFKGAGRDTTLVFNHTNNGQLYVVNLGFLPDSASFDPGHWLLTGSNTVTKIPANDVAGNQVKIFPNPASDLVNLSVSNRAGKKLIITLFNAAGQLVYKKDLDLSGGNEMIPIPLANLAPGIYTLKAGGENLKVVRKVVKARW